MKAKGWRTVLGLMIILFCASSAAAAADQKDGKENPLNMDYAAQQEKHFGPVEPMTEAEKAEAAKGFKYDPALSEDELEKALEEKGVLAPEQTSAEAGEEEASKEEGLRIELVWEENVDFDLWIENQDGRLAGPQTYTDTGPGLEVYRPSEDSSSEGDRLYYAAVYMNPPSEEAKQQNSAKAEVRIAFPGKPVTKIAATLDYEEAKDFWVACSIDPVSGTIRELNRFSSSVSEALEEES